MFRPVWNGRSSDVIVRELNKLFKELGLPYEAYYEGRPECYETVRYGWYCNYDWLPVYIKKGGLLVTAVLDTSNTDYWEETGFGHADGGGSGTWRLELEEGRIVIEFDVVMDMMDYIYSYVFRNPRLIKNK